MTTKKATETFIIKKAEERERRKEKLMTIIHEKPGETAYSLSILTGLPLSSIQNLLNELENELEIKYVFRNEKGREKKAVYITTIDDFIHDRFNFEVIDHQWTKRLMKSARKQKLPITFEMNDGSERILQPDESIDEFKKRVLVLYPL